MHINYDFFKRKNMVNVLKYHFLQIMSLIVLSAYLAKDKFSPLYSFIYIPLLMLYSYFAHIIFGHMLPYNTHLLHHAGTFSRPINLALELFTDIMFFVVPYIAQKLIGYTLIPTVYLVFYAIAYVSVHIINYSIVKFPTHEKHHKKKDTALGYCNFGPDTIDHLFGTNCDDNYENELHHVPNILASFFITYYLIHKKIIKL